MKKDEENIKAQPCDEMVVFTTYITRKGRRIYAWQYGLKAFRFTVPVNAAKEKLGN